MTNDYQNLTHYEFMRLCIHTEALGLDRKFTWGRVLRRYLRNRHIRYQVKWRIASYIHGVGGHSSRKFANWLNDRITEKHNVEIGLGALIGPGLRIGHHNGIVITCILRAGSNFHIRQNTTIGVKEKMDGVIEVGDNVRIGANSCIIADQLRIGNNVAIGANTFLNKDVPDNTTCFSRREYTMITETAPPPVHLVESAA